MRGFNNRKHRAMPRRVIGGTGGLLCYRACGKGVFENFTYDPGRGVVCESFILTVVMEKQGLVIDAKQV